MLLHRLTQDLYNEFVLDFKLMKHQIKKRAIEHYQDMQKERPMDHLVCGDVGFGKTEVAIRSSVHKRFSITSKLSFSFQQRFWHYNIIIVFKKDLKDFPVNIELISRFKKPKEIADAKLKIAAGAEILLLVPIKY